VAEGPPAAFVVLPDRTVLSVTGPPRQKFLHNILSNDVEGLKPGQGRRAALMDVKGHLLAFVRVLVDADAVRLEVAGGRREAVEQALVHYRVATPVRFAARPDVVLAVLGREARAVLARAGAETPELPEEGHVGARLAGADVHVARAGDLPGTGYVLHVPPEAVPAVVSALQAGGATELSPSSLDALRVEAGRPWYGPDVAEENLLHETGLLREYHSPTKGCYVGQEIVARLEARGGHVNKLMRGLRLTSPAAAGDPVSAEGKDVGRVTTAAVSSRLGPVALAYVHRSRSDPGSAVEVGGAPATVVALPFAEAG
jgi:tRNA-modifying protein YgfZ